MYTFSIEASNRGCFQRGMTFEKRNLPLNVAKQLFDVLSKGFSEVVVTDNNTGVVVLQHCQDVDYVPLPYNEFVALSYVAKILEKR